MMTCFVLEDSKNDKELGQGYTEGNIQDNSGDCSSVHMHYDAECCRMKEALSKPYQVRDGNY